MTIEFGASRKGKFDGAAEGSVDDFVALGTVTVKALLDSADAFKCFGDGNKKCLVVERCRTPLNEEDGVVDTENLSTASEGGEEILTGMIDVRY